MSTFKTFADWCRDRASLSPETKHTVDVMLQEAGTTECDRKTQLTNIHKLCLKATNKSR
jgi:hypothetical protein